MYRCLNVLKTHLGVFSSSHESTRSNWKLVCSWRKWHLSCAWVFRPSPCELSGRWQGLGVHMDLVWSVWGREQSRCNCIDVFVLWEGSGGKTKA